MEAAEARGDCRLACAVQCVCVGIWFRIVVDRGFPDRRHRVDERNRYRGGGNRYTAVPTARTNTGKPVRRRTD